MKTLLSVTRSGKIYNFLFIAILLYDLALRISYLGEPFRYWDSYRDYLIGHRIIQDGELPQVGPANGAFRFLSSPIYYYIIASILSIKDSILFLDFTNILLHIFAIASIYLIAKLLFSPVTGLIAVILYSSSRMVLQESFFVFQPFFAQPFLYIGLLFVTLSYLKKKYLFLVIGNILVLVASLIHNSAISALPVVLLSSFLISIKNKWGKIGFISIILIIIVLIEILYLPPITFLSKSGVNISEIIFQSFKDTSSKVDNGFLNVVHVLTNFHGNGLFASNKDTVVFNNFTSNFLFVLISAATVYYFLLAKNIKKKVITSLGVGLIISPIILASLINSYIQTRHFLVILGPLVIVISEVIRSIFNKNSTILALKILIIILLIKNFSINPADYSLVRNKHEADTTIKEMSFAIKQEVINIMQKESISDNYFFDIFIYPEIAAINGYSNAAYWIELEKMFNTRFTSLDDSAFGFGYRTLNENRYLFVICNYYASGEKWQDCINNFLRENGDYSLHKKVYLKLLDKVYLVKRKVE